MAINYIEITLCASKLHVFSIVLKFCPDSTNVAKYNNVMITGGNRTMVAAATIVSMAAAKKAQQNVFACVNELIWH